LVSGDRTPSDGLTAGIAEVGEGDGGEPRLHRHAQAEIYHILAGRGVMRLEGERLELQAGDTVFIPGGAWHGARGVGREPLRLLYVLAADSFEEVIYEFPGPA
jgi:mannose-6-phosphate isomerase-like protein (cupin superfamily)